MNPSPPNGIVTLTTDFGSEGIFVGAMKGVLLNINSSVQMVDITHEIRSHDVRTGSFQFSAAHSLFPKGTIHLVVIDPGVGSDRKGIAIETEDYFFVGPDNGVFSEAISQSVEYRAVSLESTKYFLPSISSTFHGRDIFAPIAAYISKGIDLPKFGPILDEIARLPIEAPKVSKATLTGVVRFIDNFGNIITNIDENLFKQSIQNQIFVIEFNGLKIKSLSNTYSDGTGTTPIALFNSYGLLEIALYQRNAARELKINPDDRVYVRFL